MQPTYQIAGKVRAMPEDNKAVVLRWFEEVWNQRRSETIDELITDESVCFTDQGPMRGGDGFRQLQYQPMLSAFPDLQVQVDDVIASGDDVVVRWTATGTHTGEPLPISPTMKSVTFTGISWIRARGGKLREGWQSSNISDVLRELAESSPVA